MNYEDYRIEKSNAFGFLLQLPCCTFRTPPLSPVPDIKLHDLERYMQGLHSWFWCTTKISGRLWYLGQDYTLIWQQTFILCLLIVLTFICFVFLDHYKAREIQFTRILYSVYSQQSCLCFWHRENKRYQIVIKFFFMSHLGKLYTPFNNEMPFLNMSHQAMIFFMHKIFCDI